MTDLEDAVARERSARIMHGQLCEARDRGESIDWLIKGAHTDWVAARENMLAILSRPLDAP